MEAIEAMKRIDQIKADIAGLQERHGEESQWRHEPLDQQEDTNTHSEEDPTPRLVDSSEDEADDQGQERTDNIVKQTAETEAKMKELRSHGVAVGKTPRSRVRSEAESGSIGKVEASESCVSTKERDILQKDWNGESSIVGKRRGITATCRT